jgi:PBP1b-binding outer membrane lipoprotein LpoB
MKRTKHILLIYLMAVLLVSCVNSAASEKEIKTETQLKEEAQKETIRKEEEAKEKSIEYLENVEVSDVNYAWQKNLFWFITRNFTR